MKKLTYESIQLSASWYEKLNAPHFYMGLYFTSNNQRCFVLLPEGEIVDHITQR